MESDLCLVLLTKKETHQQINQILVSLGTCCVLNRPGAHHRHDDRPSGNESPGS